MTSTFHLKSAEDLNTDIIDAIKVAFKSKAITITVEEAEDELEITEDMKVILDERLQEDEADYLTSDESINKLNAKYGI